jgi:ABC-type transporter Mla maintaining outer membrane lipid asymmetry permease subunit MlaE
LGSSLGAAVNETVVLCVVELFAVNVVLTTIGVRFATRHASGSRLSLTLA